MMLCPKMTGHPRGMPCLVHVWIRKADRVGSRDVHIDGAGNGANASRTVEVISPAEATDDLTADVESNVPSRSTKTELLRFLTQASRFLDDARASNDRSACQQLDLFTDAVSRAQRKGAISPAGAADLTQQAAQIKSGLGC